MCGTIVVVALAVVGAFTLTTAAYRWLRGRRQRRLYGSY